MAGTALLPSPLRFRYRPRLFPPHFQRRSCFRVASSSPFSRWLSLSLHRRVPSSRLRRGGRWFRCGFDLRESGGFDETAGVAEGGDEEDERPSFDINLAGFAFEAYTSPPKGKDSWRVVNHRDIIPTVPRLMGYCHVAQPVYLAAGDFQEALENAMGDGYQGDVIDEYTPVALVGEFMKGEKELLEKILQTEINIYRSIRDGSALMQRMEDFYYITLLESIRSNYQTSGEAPSWVLEDLNLVEASILYKTLPRMYISMSTNATTVPTQMKLHHVSASFLEDQWQAVTKTLLRSGSFWRMISTPRWCKKIGDLRTT
ncbi:hypothetical protein MLD38_039511 [Melastoma candidum]|uniref:Uncharacterized protein n=1 Tax=Melastoma candidum TaxID=119954 RepID=A0ACB9L2C4_9MYRT|nr:hypothetical protein MLD38_039511 [Melastoma candidum]